MDKILFPRALTHVAVVLGSQLAPTPVVGGSPDEGTTTYVVVKRTGGVQINKVLETAQFTIDVYAPDDDLVEFLATSVRAYCSGLAGTHFPGFDCKKYTEYAGPRQAPDLEAPTLSRWRFTFALHLKGTTL